VIAKWWDELDDEGRRYWTMQAGTDDPAFVWLFYTRVIAEGLRTLQTLAGQNSAAGKSVAPIFDASQTLVARDVMPSLGRKLPVCSALERATRQKQTMCRQHFGRHRPKAVTHSLST
jgi:hypothetical protein